MILQEAKLLSFDLSCGGSNIMIAKWDFNSIGICSHTVDKAFHFRVTT